MDLNDKPSQFAGLRRLSELRPPQPGSATIVLDRHSASSTSPRPLRRLKRNPPGYVAGPRRLKDLGPPPRGPAGVVIDRDRPRRVEHPE
jgi:hypothetical protein